MHGESVADARGRGARARWPPLATIVALLAGGSSSSSWPQLADHHARIRCSPASPSARCSPASSTARCSPASSSARSSPCSPVSARFGARQPLQRLGARHARHARRSHLGARHAHRLRHASPSELGARHGSSPSSSCSQLAGPVLACSSASELGAHAGRSSRSSSPSRLFGARQPLAHEARSSPEEEACSCSLAARLVLADHHPDPARCSWEEEEAWSAVIIMVVYIYVCIYIYIIYY
ncbi:hypothetical protein Dimus_038938 [Dionaea muscipula]